MVELQDWKVMYSCVKLCTGRIDYIIVIIWCGRRRQIIEDTMINYNTQSYSDKQQKTIKWHVEKYPTMHYFGIPKNKQ